MMRPLGRHVEHDERSRAYAIEANTVPIRTGPKLALFGIGCVVGGIGLAVLVGAVGCECLIRYCENRR